MNSIHESILSVSNLRKFNRPPKELSSGSREKYTSLAREPPICGVALAMMREPGTEGFLHRRLHG